MQALRYFAPMGALILTLAACSKDEPPPPRQVDLAPSSPAAPQLADVPLPAAAPAKAPAKRAPRPVPVQTPVIQPPQPAPQPAPRAATPVPIPAAPTTGTVAMGTSLVLAPASKICTNTHKAGDRFTATLAGAVQGTNGVVIPAGSPAVFRIIESTNKAGGHDSLSITYEIVSVKVGEDTYEVGAHQTENTPLQYVNIQSTTDKATKIGAGAIIGAIAGRVIGGNTKGTVIGGVVGGAAGAAVSNNTRNYIGCISETSSIALELDRPLTIRLAPKAP